MLTAERHARELRMLRVTNSILEEVYAQIGQALARAGRAEQRARLLQDRLISKCDGDIMAGR